MANQTDPIPQRLWIVAWPDPVIERLGFPADHPYSEFLWLPRLGPSATLAWRRLAGTLEHRRDGFELDLGEFAIALGLGSGVGRNAPVVRTLRRLVLFDLAAFSDASTYAVRRRVPPLAARQLERLTPQLHRTHAALLARHDAARLAARAS